MSPINIEGQFLPKPDTEKLIAMVMVVAKEY
jgi:hypothetical protein